MMNSRILLRGFCGNLIAIAVGLTLAGCQGASFPGFPTPEPTYPIEPTAPPFYGPLDFPPPLAISVGPKDTCAITEGGGVKCWGANDRGQLGNGTSADRSDPVQISGLASGATAIAVGDGHVCAVVGLGGVMCWGANDRGQLGNGTTTSSRDPVAVIGLSSGVTAIAAGDDHTCAITSDLGVKCWGRNEIGELGNSATTDSSTPVEVTGLTSGVARVAAGRFHTCVLMYVGSIKCWGENRSGGLGNGTTTASSWPVTVAGFISQIAAITVGDDHACALTYPHGEVLCWGSNNRGQLGDGSTTQRSTPVDAVGVYDESPGAIIAITAGGQHTCALIGTSEVRCWGDDSADQLGEGSGVATFSETPVDVLELRGDPTTSLVAGRSQTCARLGFGGVHCWGRIWSGREGLSTFDVAQ